MFLFGLIVGLGVGGTAVAAYLNNIHSSKVKVLEDKVSQLLGNQSANKAEPVPSSAPKN